MGEAASGTAAAVVYVHGLWMMGAEALLLQRHLWRERRYRLHVFHYGSISQPLSSVLAGLHDLIGRLRAPQVHLLGHSLGGAVILQYLERYAMLPPGRVLFMGAPVLGSRSAQSLARWSLGRRVMGGAAVELLATAGRQWRLPRELGIIAGTRPVGFSQLVLQFGEPNDGTVAVSETHLPGAKAFLTVPVTHMGLLWSALAAREAGSFLQHGRFGA